MSNKITTKYLCEDAAAEIAELIEVEQAKLDKARFKQSQHERDKSRSKFFAAKRDYHRAETGILMLREALRVVLLERACHAAGGVSVEMPDIDAYLETRTKPVVV